MNLQCKRQTLLRQVDEYTWNERQKRLPFICYYHFIKALSLRLRGIPKERVFFSGKSSLWFVLNVYSSYSLLNAANARLFFLFLLFTIQSSFDLLLFPIVYFCGCQLWFANSLCFILALDELRDKINEKMTDHFLSWIIQAGLLHH